METESIYSGSVKTGDFVAIAFPRYIDLGFYLGKGSGTSTQYYSMHRIINWSVDMERGVKTKLHKSHTNNLYAYQILKILPDTLNSEYQDMYYRAIEIIKTHKLI